MAKKGVMPPSVKPGKPVLTECPCGWKRCTYADLFNTIERPVKLVDEKEYQLVTVKRSRGGVVRREVLKGKEIKTKAAFELKEGDFLISNRQIVHGACGTVPAELAGSIVSGEYTVLGPKSGTCMDYVRHFSHSLYFQQSCFHSSIGVDIEKMVFKVDQWLKTLVNFPPPSEQQKIAEILSCWDEGIRKLSHSLDRKEEWKSEMMRHLFIEDPRTKDSRLNAVKLADVCSCYSGGTPSRSNPEYYVGDIPWIKSGELNLGEILSTEESISESALKESSAKLVEPETILLAMYGATAGVLATTKIRAAINQAILAIIPDEQRLNRRFLYHFLRFNTKELLRRVQGGQPNLSGELVKNLNLYLPDLDAQEEIGTFLDTVERSQLVSRKLLENIQLQKQALMQKLLTGKVRVSINEEAMHYREARA